MMRLPEVSVIVTCYNYGFWLHRCFRSLLNQKFINEDYYEIVFIDDGSNDNCLSIAMDYAKKFSNIIVLGNQFNEGLPASCNKAIEKSSGRYIVRVDADDYVAKEFIYLGSWFLEKNRNYQAVACDYIIVDKNENILEKVNCSKKEIACAVFFRKEYIYDVGLYDVEFKMREGQELMKRFTKKYKCGRLEFPVYKYQKHSCNRSANKEQIIKYDRKLEKKR